LFSKFIISGYIDQTGAFFIGLLAGPVCYFGCQVKKLLGYDDALDAFGVHAVGGILGGILTGFFATDSVSGRANGVFYTDTFYGGRQLGIQIYAIVFSVFWAVTFTVGILFIVDKTMGLRVSEDDEIVGLDKSIHGESMGESKPVDTKMAKLALSGEDDDDDLKKSSPITMDIELTVSNH
jgi:Amt family ammonium transporter